MIILQPVIIWTTKYGTVHIQATHLARKHFFFQNNAKTFCYRVNQVRAAVCLPFHNLIHIGTGYTSWPLALHSYNTSQYPESKRFSAR